MNSQKGYTILEVMIFLAISGFMLVAAMVAVGGRQQEVQFQQAVRDFENKINDLISDVEVGYFVRDAGFRCTATGATPDPSIDYATGISGNIQGQSDDCVLIGKAVIMGDESKITAQDQEGDKGLLRIFDMAGLRLSDDVSNIPTQDIIEAKPVALYDDSAPVSTYRLRYGLEVEKVIMYDADLPPQEESAKVLAIMNNAQAGTEVSGVSDASSSAGSTSAKIITATFDGGVSASTGLNNFVSRWRYAQDGKTPEFTTIVICVSGPNARGISGSASDWNHRETATLLVQRNGSTQLIFDGSDIYCA